LRIKSSKSIKRPGKDKGVSYVAQTTSQDLFDSLKEKVDLDEEIIIKVKGKERQGMSAISLRLLLFEDYWGCKPEEIVLTKAEEEEWIKTQKI